MDTAAFSDRSGKTVLPAAGGFQVPVGLLVADEPLALGIKDQLPIT